MLQDGSGAIDYKELNKMLRATPGRPPSAKGTSKAKTAGNAAVAIRRASALAKASSSGKKA